MRSILHDPGAEVMVGLFSFSMSLVAIGLAIIAIYNRVTTSSFIVFGMAGLSLVIALVATIILLRHITKTKGYIRQIGLYLRQGYTLRKEVLDEKGIDMTSGLKEKVTQWENDVQQWLDLNLPDYAPDFPLDTVTSTTSSITYDNVSSAASSAALHLESKTSNLREILRDLRR